MTQAINLANFSNNLDTSGGLAPSALNAPVPVNRGGTASSTIAGAITVLGPSIYPVGSVYINASVATNPATLFGFGTWTAFGSGNVPVGAGGGFTAGATGGSADAIIVNHSHTATSTVTDPGHIHQVQGGTGLGVPSGGGVVAVNNATGGIAATSLSSVTSITVATANASTGSSGTNANFQPYIVVYMWLRTA